MASRERSRWHLYQLLIGVAVGSLLTGLIVPLTSDDEQQVDAALDAGFGSGDEPADSVAGSTDRASGTTAADGSTDGAGGPDGAGGDSTETGTAPGQPSGAAPAGGADGDAPSATSAQLFASDQGVTAETVKIGFALLDIGSVGQFGVGVPGVDPAQQRAAVEAYLDDVNARGGVNGRKLEGVYANFDVVNSADHARACRELVQDKGAFMVVAAGGFEPTGSLCVTQQFGRPIVNTSTTNPDELYEDSGGLMTTIFPRGGRMMSNVAAEMAAVGLVEARKIGLVFDKRGDPTASTMNRMAAVLTELGGDVVHKSHLAGGPNEAASQVPVEVQQMQRKGAEVVFLATATVSANHFVNQSESQLYRPKWVASDWHVLYADTTTANMPPSFDGAYNFSTTRVGEWRTRGFDTPSQRIVECERIYEDATGDDIEWGENDHSLTMTTCSAVRIVEQATKLAGPDLTAASFVQGISRTGDVPTTIFGGGTFGPGKTDLNDRYRTLRWESGCRCFNPVDDFRKGRY